MSSKNQKFGRSKRRPSHSAYINGRRWAVNKDKRIRKNEARKQDKVDNPPKVARGTARRKSRVARGVHRARPC